MRPKPFRVKALTRRWRRARRRRSTGTMPDPLFGIRTTEVRFDGAVYFVPEYAQHRGVSRKIMRKQYEAPRLHDVVKTVMARSGGSMVHAGAFFGDMLPSFSRKTPGTVYAFEPVVENYLLARAVVHENDLDNVVLMHAGLGADPGVAWVETMTRQRHRGGHASIVSGPEEPTRRPQRTPLLAVDQLDIEDLSLVQLDVEGFELPILEGAERTIRSQQPAIVVEDDLDNCSDFLRDLGYSEAARLGRDHLYLTESAAAELSDLVEQLPPPGERIGKRPGAPAPGRGPQVSA